MLMRTIALALLLTACGQPGSYIKKLLTSHFETLNKHDADGLKKDYTTSASGTAPNWGKDMHSADSIAYQYSRLFVSTPDLKFEVTNTLVGMDHAMVEYTMTGTLTILEKEVPEYMRGKKYSFPATTVFEFTDGKIVREASYFDQVVFLRQVGFFDQK